MVIAEEKEGGRMLTGQSKLRARNPARISNKGQFPTHRSNKKPLTSLGKKTQFGTPRIAPRIGTPHEILG